MFAMLAIPAALGVVHVQQDWRSRMASATVSKSRVLIISSSLVSRAAVVRVESRRLSPPALRIASSKLRWVQGGEDNIHLKGLQRRLSAQQRHANLPAPRHVVCGTCGDNSRRKTCVNWLAPSPRNLPNHNSLREGLSKRALFLIQATTGLNEPHAANPTWMPASELPKRGSSVRTNAGRNKKWRNLDKGRLEGNKRTRGNGNGNANPGKSKPQTPGPDKTGRLAQAPEGGVNEDETERAERVPRVKPKKGPKPKERVSWAGQDMLLLNANERFKVGREVTPWASAPSERMPDDYYKYGPFGPHAWKGVCVGTPRRGTLCDQLVVFFSSVENEEEHELNDIQDASIGYGKRVDQMDESVGIQYYFAFVRQIQKLTGLPPWTEWTLVSQVAVESGAELDKWNLGSNLHPQMRQHLAHCVAWYRPDLIYVKRPGFQVRFEPQKVFLEELLKLVNPDNAESSYYPKLCKLLGVDVNETAEQAGITFDGFSEDRKMESVEHVLTSHPVWLLGPYTVQAMEKDQRQKAMGGMTSGLQFEPETPESEEEKDDWSEDESLQNADKDDEEEDLEDSEIEAFGGQYGEDFDFDEQDDGQGNGNEWEREEAKALAAEAMQYSPDATKTLDDVDDEFWNEQVAMAYSDIGIKSTKGQRTVEGTAEETETQGDEENFLDAAVRPFTYSNLIQEIFIIRKALVDYPELRR